VNLREGSDVNGRVYFGSQSTPVINSQLNVQGGRASAVESWTGSEVNVSARSIRSVSLLGAQGKMSGGTVGRWDLFARSQLVVLNGCVVIIETAGLDTANDPDSSLLVVEGGQIGSLDATGNVIITGGIVGDGFVFRGGGYVDIRGGNVGNHFSVGYMITGAIPGSDLPIVVGSGGQVKLSGGSIGDDMVLYGGRNLIFSGGSIGSAFRALEGSHVNIIGSHFLVDGVELNPPDDINEIMVTQRNVTLSGILADGQPFRFDLNDIPDQIGSADYFSPGAEILVTFVPEPPCWVIIAIPLAIASCTTTRLRRQA
jgi:hypothetical protein